MKKGKKREVANAKDASPTNNQANFSNRERSYEANKTKPEHTREGKEGKKAEEEEVKENEYIWGEKIVSLNINDAGEQTGKQTILSMETPPNSCHSTLPIGRCYPCLPYIHNLP